MNRFQREKKRFQNRRAAVQTGVFLLLMAAFYLGVESVSEGARERQIRSLEQALRKSMVQCYALEGRYPASVEYMEEHYGLTYDKKRYLVDYEPVGSNLMPDVMVLEKEDGR